MNFLADGMLGKLARWLRMLGQDVVYSTELNDAKLLEMAKNEKRVLLTKDLELYKRSNSKGIEAFYVDEKTESEQLAKLSQRYSFALTLDMEKSHCPLCNTKLKSASKEQLLGELEKNTFANYEKFWKCPNCGQVYWQGAHWKQINNTVNQAQMMLRR